MINILNYFGVEAGNYFNLLLLFYFAGCLVAIFLLRASYFRRSLVMKIFLFLIWAMVSVAMLKDIPFWWDIAKGMGSEDYQSIGDWSLETTLCILFCLAIVGSVAGGVINFFSVIEIAEIEK